MKILWTSCLAFLFQCSLWAQINVPYVDFCNALQPDQNYDQISITRIGAFHKDKLKFYSPSSHKEILHYKNGKVVLVDAYVVSPLGFFYKSSFDSIFYKQDLVAKIVSYEIEKESQGQYGMKHVIIPEYNDKILVGELYFDRDSILTQRVAYSKYYFSDTTFTYSLKVFDMLDNKEELTQTNTYESVRKNNQWNVIYALTTNQTSDTLDYVRLDTVFQNLNCEISARPHQSFSLNASFLQADSLINVRYIEAINPMNTYYQYILYQYSAPSRMKKKEVNALLRLLVSEELWVNEDLNFMISFEKKGNKYIPKTRIINRNKKIPGYVADYRMLDKGEHPVFFENGELFSELELGRIKYTIENVLGNKILVLESVGFLMGSIRLASVKNKANDVMAVDFSTPRNYLFEKYPELSRK